MNIQTAQFLVEATENACNQEIDLQQSYSGRGMYGRSTAAAAVVVDDFGQLLADVLNYIQENIGEGDETTEGQRTWEGVNLTEEIGRFNVDSMGRGVVIY